MNEEPESLAPAQSHKVFWRAFWVTIGLFLVIYIYANYSPSNGSKFTKNKDGSASIIEEYLKPFKELLPDLRYLTTSQIKKARQLIHRDIERELDQAYAPVYDQIPKFTDYHYSVTGEYTEIAAMLAAKFTGNGAHSLTKMLFEDVNFGKRLKSASRRINIGALQHVQKKLQKVSMTLRKKMDLSSTDSNIVSKGFHLTSSSVKARFSYELLTLRGGSILASKAMTKAVAKKIGLAIGKKVAAKVAIKTGAKVSATIVAGGTGVAACAGVGPFAVICGGGAAVVTWFATDKIILELDEAFNRKSFEAQLKDLLDKQKAELKAEMTKGYDNFLDKVSDAIQSRMIKASSPAELLAE